MILFPYPLHESTIIYWHLLFFVYHEHDLYMNVQYSTDIHCCTYTMTLYPYPLHESTIIYWHLLFYVYHEHVLYMNVTYSTDIHWFTYTMTLYPYPLHESTIFNWHPMFYVNVLCISWTCKHHEHVNYFCTVKDIVKKLT